MGKLPSTTRVVADKSVAEVGRTNVSVQVPRVVVDPVAVFVGASVGIAFVAIVLCRDVLFEMKRQLEFCATDFAPVHCPGTEFIGSELAIEVVR